MKLERALKHGLFAALGGVLALFAAAAPAEWTTPQIIDFSGTNADEARHPRVAIDSYGNGISIWSQEGGDPVLRHVFSRSYLDLDLAWEGGQAAVVSDPEAAGGVIEHIVPQLAINSAGQAVALWGQYVPSDVRIHANRHVSGWGTPLAISAAGEDSTQPSLVLDGLGAAVAAWQFAPNSLFTRTQPTSASAWAAQSPVGTGSHVSVARGGLVTAFVWINAGDEVTAAINGGADTRVDSGANASTSVKAIADSSGNILVVWTQSDGSRPRLRGRMYDAVAASWGELLILDDGAGSGDAVAFGQDVAVAGNGDFMVVWTQSNGTRDRIYARRYVAGGGDGSGWGSAEPIDSAAGGMGEASDPAVSMSPHVMGAATSRATAVWKQFDGTRTRVLANRFVPGNSWQGTQTLDTDTLQADSRPDVATDPVGNALAVWVQEDGDAKMRVHASRFRTAHAVTGTSSPEAGGNIVCVPDPVPHGGNTVCMATAADGYSHTGWFGSCANEAGAGTTCELNDVRAPTAVTAAFAATTSHTVTASVDPSAGGTISCDPNPVLNGADSVCTLTLATGYSLTGWTGCDSTSGNTCTLSNVTASRGVTANVALNTYGITTNANPGAGGSVSCTPNPVQHGADATCTATINSGYNLTGWTGCDSTSGNTCTLSNVTAARSVTANFEASGSGGDGGDAGGGTGGGGSSGGNVSAGCSIADANRGFVDPLFLLMLALAAGGLVRRQCRMRGGR